MQYIQNVKSGCCVTIMKEKNLSTLAAYWHMDELHGNRGNGETVENYTNICDKNDIVKKAQYASFWANSYIEYSNRFTSMAVYFHKPTH